MGDETVTTTIDEETLVETTDPAPVEVESADQEDPYLWLEEIEGEAALAQVKEWNAETEAKLADVPGVEERAERARKILNDPNRLVTGSVIGDKVLNHWQDENNKRGLWRIADLDDYLAGDPEWTTLIDVDALSEEEGEAWVWHGANCLAPAYERCLVSLSPGGSDADIMREFDLTTGTWVEDGFMVPLGKSSVAWVDEDTLLVAKDEGGDSLTESGYPRTAKLWTRGTDWSEARQILDVEREQVWLFPTALMDGDKRWIFLQSGPDFFNQDRFVLVDGEPVKLDLPQSVEPQGVLDGQYIATLVDPLGDFRTGDLVSWDLEALARGETPAPKLVMRPTASQAVDSVATTDNKLWITALDDVSGKLFILDHGEDGWTAPGVIDLPDNSTLGFAAASGKRDVALVTVSSMLQPTTLYAVGSDGSTTTVQQLPEQFDASNMSVTQHFATSKDGTRIPYFLVRRNDVTEPTGTLIHAYGGFRAPSLPQYLVSEPSRSGPLALFWVESGGAYVLANIRGGGEYGPAWHEAALREKRQNSFDDLAAVAEDLIARGVARADGVAISGRSNGGVLTGAGITQRPDLYRAAIIGAPLFDMKRYHKLLAGASWVGEYGNPDDPADWAFMKEYSPYQNIKPGVEYPATFWYLSTKDDRVHPGHARKGAARLEAYGNDVYYRENLEGGHSVSTDQEANAVRAALEWAFMMKEVGTTAPE
ncbi:prolyl oligopeptidase family serine peptidase [Sphingomicrobium sp. B8]|uniref:Prolyl oligopeptidase family serine peptidase n=2 Tax=Sphingomicrobium clamense TaxID=2851013 RepID=A0ABS6V4W6_9SPHN|nr:prolyl oligopeptidase family serine peptidase [Sphingomicrobium sp. B8]